MKKIQLYFPKNTYNELAGPDWPSYEEFLKGDRGSTIDIADEINSFVDMFTKDGILFPIRTATSCQSKWTWSTIFLNQLSTASCHRVKPIPLDIDNFDNFHNLPKKINDRRLMLNGEWPTGGCEYCRDIEQAGGWSDRMHNLDIRDLTPPELEEQENEVYVTPRLVEIFAQNACNLACTYCNSNLSSKIEQENKKFGEFNKHGVSIPITEVPALADDVFEKFIDWLTKNIRYLKRLHLLGGETFIQHRLLSSVLDIIEKNPNPELQFCIFSNLNVPDKWWDLYINRIRDLQKSKCIKVFDLTASIDCWGAEAEYARYGLNLDKFESRLAWAAEEDESWLGLNINQTITCLTMGSMSTLVEKISQYSKHRHIGHYFEFYVGPQMFQHPKIYPWKFWEPYMNKVLDQMPRNTNNQLEAIQRMSGISAFLKSFNLYQFDEIEKLFVYLDELDRRRGTDWRSIFPYLMQ